MKRSFFIILGAWLALLAASLNCMAVTALLPATATPTATQTLTPTASPSATPSLTPTITPTPTPDYHSLAIQAADLPPGFVPLDLSGSSPPAGFQMFFYGHAVPLQLVGEAVVLIKPVDQFNFDAKAGNPDIFIQSLTSGFQGTIKNLKPYPGLDHLGDVSNGYTGQMIHDQTTSQADFFVMRLGSVGILVFSVYEPGAKPLISLPDLAALALQRLTHPYSRHPTGWLPGRRPLARVPAFSQPNA